MKHDMRTKPNKQHLGTADKRNEYEQRGHVVTQDSKVKQDEMVQQQQVQKGESK